MSKKTLRYKAICINPNVNLYSMKKLVVGETYDIYSCMYPDGVRAGIYGTSKEYTYKEELEIFKDGEYYTSFTHNSTNLNKVGKMYRHFKPLDEVRQEKLNDLGI